MGQLRILRVRRDLFMVVKGLHVGKDSLSSWFFVPSGAEMQADLICNTHICFEESFPMRGSIPASVHIPDALFDTNVNRCNERFPIGKLTSEKCHQTKNG